MIGRAGENGHGAIDLLRQHGPHEGVGPGLHAERQLFPRGVQDAGREPVRSADDQHKPPLAPVAQLGDAVGKGAGGVGRPVLVAGDKVGALGQGGEDRVRLGVLAGLLRFDFQDVDRS